MGIEARKAVGVLNAGVNGAGVLLIVVLLNVQSVRMKVGREGKRICIVLEEAQ